MSMNNNKVNFLGADFPTYYSRNTATTPDIVLFNNKTFHNISINPGPVTSSGHIPVIIKTTTRAIPIPAAPKLNTNKTNGETFKDDIPAHVSNINTEPQ